MRLLPFFTADPCKIELPTNIGVKEMSSPTTVRYKSFYTPGEECYLTYPTLG